MKKIKQAIATIAVLITLSITAFSQVLDSKTERVKTLMNLTGSSKQFKQVIDAMAASFKNTSPNMHSGMFDSMMKELNLDELKTQMVPFYVKHFSEQDIDNMLAFYQSETGKKMIEKMPLIMAEYMPIVQERVKFIMEKMRKEQGIITVKP